jgi:hypothetical protein
MRRHRDKVSVALRKHCHGTVKALLAASTLTLLAAWTGQGTPVAAVHTGAAGVSGAIMSAIHHKCLSTYPSYTGSGLIAGIEKCNGSRSERWTLPADNTIRIRGKCLAVKKKASGTGIVLAKCDGSHGQFWEINGVVRVPGTELTNPWSGKCMTDPNGSTADGTQVRLYTCKRSADQIWYLP